MRWWDIHGQGEQSAILSPANHLEMLDEFAGLAAERKILAQKFSELSEVQDELASLREDEEQKLQLIDILQFQVSEIGNANLQAGEDDEMEEEKRRLNNAKKLSTLSDEALHYFMKMSDRPSRHCRKQRKNAAAWRL